MSSYYKEGFVLQVILYSSVWLIDEYMGLLLCMIAGAVMGGLLVFALVVELIQKSKVPRTFFYWMTASTLAPILVVLAFSMLYGGQFDWLK